MNRNFPHWIKARHPQSDAFDQTLSIIEEFRLHTVCQSAECPNRGECFANGTATFLLLGDICTRSCRFCAVSKGKPKPLDGDEPRRIAQAVKNMGLHYVVITSVTRDDLPDGGASVFVETVRWIQNKSPLSLIEVLTPDFQGKFESLQTIASAGPDVFNHNVETVPRLYSTIRPQADYQRSLWVLSEMKSLLPSASIKSGLMVGLGEREDEVITVLEDLRKTGCDFITIGQYLSPSAAHQPVEKFIHPEQFAKYYQIALSRGFTGVASGPLVRSSYHAQKTWERSQYPSSSSEKESNPK